MEPPYLCGMRFGLIPLFAAPAAGPWRATLFAPDGSVLSRQSGSGPSNIRFRPTRAGMTILGLETKGGTLMRKVAF